MGLFGKKRELSPLIPDEELFPSVNYDSVLEWLVGLSDKEYDQVCLVAAQYRVADQEAAKILGKPNKPTTRIDDPKDHLQTLPSLRIDKEPAFLLEDEKPKRKDIDLPGAPYNHKPRKKAKD